MADNERPAKIQKREHSPQAEEAAFAPAHDASVHNGSATTEQQPDQATQDTKNDVETSRDDAGADAMDVEELGEAQASPANAGDAAEGADKPAKPGPPPGMTKSAWKKLKRQQEWEAGREARKVVRKEKAKARKERKREAYAAGADDPSSSKREQDHKARSQRPTQLPVTFIFDCGFDDLMQEGEIKSLGQQITRAYSDNKNAPFRAHMAVSSFGGRLKERFEGLLAGQYKSWKGFRTFEEDYMEVAKKAKEWMKDPHEGGRLAGKLAEVAERMKKTAAESADAQEGAEAAPGINEKEGEVIYLSSEGTETLHDLKPYSTYIIGGLVDKNRYKGLCHQRATERGVKTAKLPIGEFLQMNSRKVLATNHVNEIMVHWLTCGDWGEAFTKAIPKRKGGKLKSADGGDDDESDHAGEDQPDGPADETQTAGQAEEKVDSSEAAPDALKAESEAVPEASAA